MNPIDFVRRYYDDEDRLNVSAAYKDRQYGTRLGNPIPNLVPIKPVSPISTGDALSVPRKKQFHFTEFCNGAVLRKSKNKRQGNRKRIRSRGMRDKRKIW